MTPPNDVRAFLDALNIEVDIAILGLVVWCYVGFWLGRCFYLKRKLLRKIACTLLAMVLLLPMVPLGMALDLAGSKHGVKVLLVIVAWIQARMVSHE